MTRFITALFAGLFLLHAAAFAAGGDTADDNDYFLLPETPPNIERVKKPSLDRPVLKRQNFVTDTEIVPPPVLLGDDFKPFSVPEYPVSFFIGRGSYASSDGGFVYTALSGWQLSCGSTYTAGEAANLARDATQLSYRLDRFASPGVRVRGGIDLDEDTVWTQRHSRYGFSSKVDWYLREDMNMAVLLSGAAGEIKGQEADGSWQGDIALNFQPTPKQNIKVSLDSRTETALANDAILTTVSLMNDFLLSRKLTAGLGGRWQNDKLFPQADVNYIVVPRLRLNVLYQPGFDRPDWAALYIGDRFEKTNSSLMPAEAGFLIREKLSYYWREDNSAGLVFSQANWKNYIAWSPVAGTALISPVNAAESYVSSAELDFACRWREWKVTAGGGVNSNSDLTYVPEYTLSLGLAWTAGSWTLSSGYRAVSAISAAPSGTERLPAFGDLSLALQKAIVRGLDITLSADNLLEERIESQSGFFRRGSAFRAGLKLQF